MKNICLTLSVPINQDIEHMKKEIFSVFHLRVCPGHTFSLSKGAKLVSAIASPGGTENGL